MSFAAATLTFREGLEAALILAIMLGYLRKMGRSDRHWSVWAGALSAALMAVAFTVFLQFVGTQFDYPAKGVYEGATSFIAVGMLTYMIFWMRRQARHIKGSLEFTMKESMAKGAAWGLFLAAFMTVAREGVETALFLSASAFQSSGMATLIGGIVGLLVALGVAWAMYVVGLRIQLRTFFTITSLMLVVFAAAILRYGIQEFQEVGWLPAIIDPVWDSSRWLPTSSGLGTLLQALVGYVSKPSLVQLIGYFGYLGVVGTVLLRPVKKQTPPLVAMPSVAEPVEVATSQMNDTVAQG